MSLYAVTNVLGQIWGPLFSRGPPRSGGTGALPPALHTPTYMWCEHAKAKAHMHCNICEFLGNNYCIPKRWPMGPLQQIPPPLFKPLVTPLLGRCHTVCVRRKVPSRLDVNKARNRPVATEGLWWA